MGRTRKIDQGNPRAGETPFPSLLGWAVAICWVRPKDANVKKSNHEMLTEARGIAGNNEGNF